MKPNLILYLPVPVMAVVSDKNRQIGLVLTGQNHVSGFVGQPLGQQIH
jgi:hypothetical protein